jgi:hypothetical protein
MNIFHNIFYFKNHKLFDFNKFTRLCWYEAKPRAKLPTGFGVLCITITLAIFHFFYSLFYVLHSVSLVGSLRSCLPFIPTRAELALMPSLHTNKGGVACAHACPSYQQGRTALHTNKGGGSGGLTLIFKFKSCIFN